MDAEFLLQKQALILQIIAAPEGSMKQKIKCSALHY